MIVPTNSHTFEVRGGDPSQADPTPPESVYPFTPIPPLIGYSVLVLVLVCAVVLSFGCAKRVVVYEQPVIEPEQAQEVRIFPEEEDPPALVQSCEPVIVVGALYFGLDRSDVEAEGVRTVEALAGYLRGCSAAVVTVAGYCDERGGEEENLGLGQRRAGAVSDLLVSFGVEGSQVKTLSYGEGGLAVVGCKDDGCHRENRRVEFQLEGVNDE